MKLMLTRASNAGKLTLLIGLLLLAPLLVLPFYPEDARFAAAFLIPGSASILLGALMCAKRSAATVSESEAAHRGNLLVLYIWAYGCLAGALPFVLGDQLCFVQGLFEAVSGWTTTGLSVMYVTVTPHIFLFYRSFMQFCGGLGFVMIMMAFVQDRIKTIMITGDNPLTAATIAAEAGVDDFLAEATPEGKLEMIRDFQRKGHLVAMTGDGTNDAPALAQADVAVAMNSGTQAAKEAGNMVDLDSSPTKLIDVVRIGKQLLMTRGSLTTFSIANDVAKYFAIIPAMFIGLFPGLQALNIMKLHSPESAILSAIIYNALIIIALIPLALKGVKYREVPAKKLLSHNLLVYGLGGLAAPFIFIKLIDLILVALRLV